LQKKNFRSAPIWDEEEGHFVGFIDEMDLLEFAEVYAHHSLEKGTIPKQLKEKYCRFTNEEIERLSFGEGTMDTILKLPGTERRRIFVFQSNALLSNAMQIIKDYERILVQHVVKPLASDSSVRLFVGRLFTRTHSITEYKICSQTDILQYISQHIKDRGESVLQNLKVKDCGDLGAITSITENEPAIDGFLKMIDSKSNSCAVVNNQNRIVASLSPSHLRGMNNEKLKAILLPVTDFFPAMTGSKSPPPLVCTLEEKLVDVIKKILKSSTRRCWVVDGEYRPLGYLSMGKIIVCVLTNPCIHFST